MYTQMESNNYNEWNKMHEIVIRHHVGSLHAYLFNIRGQVMRLGNL